ncbi:Mut7-C RNAse domain-containing protein [Georgenia ruanii]|uniref:Mut7-C ubiquitin/RNAse domain-containing protein n=1 Tax=Georgenia ruanii TaxID=348442 RepID=A0A7J9UVS5_9MICO|nr:Mut7-C RNAse domain-containing protein [Georgenia ruanii]MPV88725.1 hypothetical protein [Georgenia ruanii]
MAGTGDPAAEGPAGLLRVEIAPELRFHLPPPRRRPALTVPADPAVTVGHVVQALGVPLTEVGRLVLDGGPVDPPARAVGALLVVPVAPAPQPAPTAPPRFVLDVHLGSLARRLRLLGLDVAYARDAADDALVAAALAEDRVLLTRDREMLRRRALSLPPRHAAFVRATAVEAQAVEVLRRFAPPLAPWTRCLVCGGPLEPATKAELGALLPAGTRRTYDEFARCARCGRPFWRGAHSRGLEAAVRRAEAALGEAASAGAAPGLGEAASAGAAPGRAEAGPGGPPAASGTALGAGPGGPPTASGTALGAGLGGPPTASGTALGAGPAGDTVPSPATELPGTVER